MANARKLPSGSWRVQVFSHYEEATDKDGKVKKKRIYESFTCDDPSPRGKKKAEQMALEYILDRDNKTQCNYTLEEAIELYINSKKNVLSPTTIRGYKTLKGNAYGSLLTKSIKRITQYDIQRWANEFSINHAPNTVYNAHRLLSSAIRTFEPSKHINAKLPRREPVKRYVPTDDDIKKLLEYVKGTELENAVLLSAYGTLRRGELCALTDADIEGNVIHITKSMVHSSEDEKWIIKPPKTVSSYRDVVYPDFVIEHFKERKGRLVNMKPDSISADWKKTLRKAGVHEFRFHDLRAYSASIMHALGIPDQYIMSRGGWKSDGILKRVYRRSMDDKEREFTDKLNTHFETMQHEMQHG